MKRYAAVITFLILALVLSIGIATADVAREQALARLSAEV